MIKKVYKLGNESREVIKRVSRQVSDILGKTLGPAGKNYFLPIGITNDGRTIMSEIRFEDEAEDQVALAFHEIAFQQDKDAGDGTTTAIVLGAETAYELADMADVMGKSPMELLRNLEDEKNQALKLLKEKVIKVESLEDLKKVAFTALENKEVADLVAETMFKGGKDSYPIIDNGFNEKVETSIVDGIELPFEPQNKIYNQIKREYHNVAVIVANHCFESYLELQPFLMSMLGQKEKPQGLLVAGKQFSIPFVNSVSETARRANFPIILVSGNFHNDTFEDVAAYVDAKSINTHPRKAEKITDLKFQDAGFCKKAIIMDKSTQFIGGRGLEAMIFGEKAITRVGKRVEEIKERLKTEKDEKERSQMEKRIAALLGGITTVFVDAKTATEKYYLKLKIEDAMNSCRGALNEGMVKGGGLALKEISEEMNLLSTLARPYEKIIQNNQGEMDTTDIYDAYSVVKGTIENSVSVVKVLLTIEGIIANKEKDLVEQLSQKLYVDNSKNT